MLQHDLMVAATPGRTRDFEPVRQREPIASWGALHPLGGVSTSWTPVPDQQELSADPGAPGGSAAGSADPREGRTMTTARDIMSGGAECARTSDTLSDAARKMKDLDVGALPICGDDNRLHGVITDRDIVVDCIAADGDPKTTTVQAFSGGETVTIGADDSVEEALQTMIDHGVRRLPVIDGHDLIGILTQADVAKNLSDDQIGKLVEAISTAPANN
ncbi:MULTISPECIES: CBS domain-containing protein [unclassified Nocardioides]|uniref:CBS domain-containing protein n=1 Tax=unclassified Nocardioides TaxID=2615069 RepID=UPI00360B274A